MIVYHEWVASRTAALQNRVQIITPISSHSPPATPATCCRWPKCFVAGTAWCCAAIPRGVLEGWPFEDGRLYDGCRLHGGAFPIRPMKHEAGAEVQRRQGVVGRVRPGESTPQAAQTRCACFNSTMTPQSSVSPMFSTSCQPPADQVATPWRMSVSLAVPSGKVKRTRAVLKA